MLLLYCNYVREKYAVYLHSIHTNPSTSVLSITTYWNSPTNETEYTRESPTKAGSSATASKQEHTTVAAIKCVLEDSWASLGGPAELSTLSI